MRRAKRGSVVEFLIFFIGVLKFFLLRQIVVMLRKLSCNLFYQSIFYSCGIRPFRHFAFSAKVENTCLGSAGASGCPTKKDENNLCDCGNKICDYSKGQNLNPDTCKCEGGSSKREINEDDYLDNQKNAFVATLLVKDLESASESDSDEKRGMIIPSSKFGQGKRFLRLTGNE